MGPPRGAQKGEGGWRGGRRKADLGFGNVECSQLATRNSSKRHRQSVVGQFHAGGQLGVDGTVVEVVGDVRQQGPSRGEFGRHGQGLVQTKMRRVRLASQAIKDQYVEPPQLMQAGGGDRVGVGAVGDVAEAEAEYVAAGPVAQPQWYDRGAQHLERLESDGAQLELGHRARMQVFGRGEGVVERSANAIFDLRFAIEGHGPAEIKLHQPQVVQAKDMVGVSVGVDDRVDDADLLAQELLPQVGRRIDEQIPLGQAEDHAAPRAAIARIVAGAHGAVAANGRHADRSAGPQQDQLAGDVATGRLAWHARSLLS